MPSRIRGGFDSAPQFSMRDSATSSDVAEVCQDFERENKKSVVFEKAGVKPDSKNTSAALLRVGEGRDQYQDAEKIFKLGVALRKFISVMDQYPDLSPEKVGDLSALVKWSREFLLSGKFLEAASKLDTTPAWLGFLVNQLAKIKETKAGDDKGYIGPGQSMESFSLSEPGMEELIAQVDSFADSYFKKGAWQKKRKKGKMKPAEQEMGDQLKSKCMGAKNRAKELESGEWEGRNAEGLYGLKHAITVTHFFSRGHNLVDLEKVSGKDNIKDRLRKEGKLPNGYLLYYYDFDKAEFGAHATGEPIPKQDGKGRGDRIIHYDPDTILYVGLIVEYFKNKKKKEK